MKTSFKQEKDRKSSLQCRTQKWIALLVTIFIYLITSSCEEFLQVDAPRTDLVRKTVFTNAETANATLISIYGQMVNSGFASGQVNGISFLTSLSSDELQNVNSGFAASERQEFYNNELLPANQLIASTWTDLYQYIFKANAIIEGIENSDIDKMQKDQLIAEAKFIRSFSYFYLINLFGDVPLALTSDFRINASIARTDKAETYAQIISDLEDAQTNLIADFSKSNGERVRPNKWTAAALLARVFLYTEDWASAEERATAIIDNTTTFSLLANLNEVFLTNSAETIWQLARKQQAAEAPTYIFSGTPTNAILSPLLVNSFETGDGRKLNWIGSTTDGATTFYFPFKYKVVEASDPVQEYSMVFRLAEQFLIRSEARARQGNIDGAQADLNAIRNRANLPGTTAANLSTLLTAIEQERRMELFTEWGHRWLDVKRTSRVDEVLSPLKITWESFDALYPIPQVQRDYDVNVTQNPGY